MGGPGRITRNGDVKTQINSEKKRDGLSFPEEKRKTPSSPTRTKKGGPMAYPG